MAAAVDLEMDDAVQDRSRGDAGPATASLPWIDWIRFLAAMEVFLYHLGPYSFDDYNRVLDAHRNAGVLVWRTATSFGTEAVLVFFALSGYLVGGGLIERARAGTFRPAAYAIDRATRLMLPFVPALALCLTIEAIKREPIDLARTLGNLASLQGVLVRVDPYLGVDWSLAYETWFYVLGGALAALLTVPKRRGLALGVAAAALLVLSAIKNPMLTNVWVLGALFSQLPLRRASWGAILGGAAVCGLGLFLSNGAFQAHRPAWLQDAARVAGLVNMLIAFGVLVVLHNLAGMRPRSRGAARLDRLGTRLASFSYSLYLIHIPVLAVLALIVPRALAVAAPLPVRYAGYALIVLAAAYGFYWLFERRTDAVRRWLKRRLAV